MKWSFSKSKMFRKCQKQWYFYEILANPRSRDALRHEAYLLKQLQSIYAWRGSLVDKVISNFIIPRIKAGSMPTEKEVLGFASGLAEKQLAFGTACKHRGSGITKTACGADYSAFYEVEYNGGLDAGMLSKAKDEINLSLKNLLSSNFFREFSYGRNVINMIPQRTLSFQFAGENVSATPDLIIFFRDDYPAIVDWKVHYFGAAEYWLQLGIYALSLSKVKPHVDFPSIAYDKLKDPAKIRIIEYQLLQDKQREHSVAQDDVAEIEDYIFSSITSINSITKNNGSVDANVFQSAHSPSTCVRCQFKKICWDNPQGVDHGSN